jgi:hypothetical protein
MYVVTRQKYWPDGDEAVEVSSEFDYVSPDALTPKFADEMVEFDLPSEAVETALSIAEQWSAELNKNVPLTLASRRYQTSADDAVAADELQRWAQRLESEMPACENCGGLMPDARQRWYHVEYDEIEFCSENCADTFC